MSRDKQAYKYWTLALALFVCLQSFSCVQNKSNAPGYAISVYFNGPLPNDTLFLSAYYGDAAQKIDSLVRLNEEATQFCGDTHLVAGMYTIKSVKYPDMGIDFFISDGAPQHFTITYNPLEGLSSFVVEESPENKAFADYIKTSIEKQRERMQWEAQWKNGNITPDSAVLIHRRINLLVQEVKTLTASLEKEYAGSTLALFLKLIQEPEAPISGVPDTAPNRDSLLQVYYYNFYKDHYWDNVNFADERVIRMPFLKKRMHTFFANMLPPDPSVLIPQVDVLLAKASVNRQVYEFAVRDLYEFFRTSPYPEMYQVAIHIGEGYVLNESDLWEDKNYVGKMAVAVHAAKLNPVGEPATDLHLQAPDGKIVTLYEVKSPYTLIYFYDPECESCTVITPEVYRLYLKYRSKGLQVYAVYIEGDKKGWEKYIRKNKMEWLNVWDAHDSEDIYGKYDIHAIPMMLLLDKNKTVLAKDFLPDVLEYMLEKL